ncbi:MAG: glycine--tRNA ligase subunit beta [Desulfomonilaceae bacterium]|nr:glycine--tRNA ligase subunit beta [Desulfomonilaceae bacterium]
MKGEFLLEIGTEEIPAGFMASAIPSLKELMGNALAGARIGYGTIEVFATPRRLILQALDVAPAQTSIEIEKTGPPVGSAYDENGKPTKAALGFAKSQGVDVSDLYVVKTGKGEQVAVRKAEKGRPTPEVLGEMIPALLEKISFPKTMRWMDLDVRFARPIHWITALYEGTVVPFDFGNIRSGNLSRGHRFTHPEPFRVTSLDDLRDRLHSQRVFIDPAQRRETILEQVKALAARDGLHIFDDPELLDEVTYLVESPYPIMGEFSPDFLELPASILITCMKKHQRYFSVQDADGRITNRFIAVNNTPVKDEQVSVKGHQRVLKARLEDAKFYFQEDRKTPLFDRLDALKGVTFHSKLGTAYEKVERFTHLARLLAERLAPDKTQQVERAALLCKCDLETGIVYEFPELQGIIGSYYAKMDGEPKEVSTAVREHYLPSYAGDSLPEGIVGSIVSVADRIDTIVGCFGVGLTPTGGTDPYALRRHALGVIQILINLDRPLDLGWLVREADDLLDEKRTRPREEVEAEVMEFIRTRFVNFHTTRGYALDVVEAVVRARFADPVDAYKRAEALNQWKQRDDFDAIIIGFKRVVNILKDTRPAPVAEALFQEEAERSLFAAFKSVEKRCAPLIQSGAYFEALTVIAELKTPIDTLFDTVMVMVEDEKLRGNRLGLLKEIAGLFETIADFSFIGSTAEAR